MCSKIILFSLLLSVAYGRNLILVSKNQEILTVSLTGLKDVTLLPHAAVNLTIDDSYTGKIWACASTCGDTKTVAHLNLGSTSDEYSVSLVNGFNFPIKVVPVNAHDCRAAVCEAHINNLCPPENSITNSLGVTVACKSTPDLFQKVCPIAVVVEGDVANVQKCSSSAYKVIIG